jgi:hypothetical protein
MIASTQSAPNLGVISEVFGKEAKRLLRGKSAPLP